MGKIDMSKYKIRTDLAIESIKDYKDEIKSEEKVIDDIKITKIEVLKEHEERRVNI